MDTAHTLVDKKQWQEKTITTSRFPLKAFFSPDVVPSHKENREILTVYIEGDGLAWKNRYKPSDDPTPRNPMGLRIALADPREDVAYLARPCQYIKNKDCTTRYWTKARFSEPVIASLSEAIDTLKNKNGYQRVQLIGFSGGGSLAMLLAAKRGDVASLMTVGSPLDHEEWTRWHKVTSLSGSLNPAAYAKDTPLATLPQWHFCGKKDDISPCTLMERFAKKYGERMPDANFVRVEKVTHHCCWPDKWPELLRKAGYVK